MSQPDDALLERIGNAITLPHPRVAEIYDLLAAEHQDARLMALPSPPTPPYLAGLQQACEGEWFAALVERLLHAGAYVAESTDAWVTFAERQVELHGDRWPVELRPARLRYGLRRDAGHMLATLIEFTYRLAQLELLLSRGATAASLQHQPPVQHMQALYSRYCTRLIGAADTP